MQAVSKCVGTLHSKLLKARRKQFLEAAAMEAESAKQRMRRNFLLEETHSQARIRRRATFLLDEDAHAEGVEHDQESARARVGAVFAGHSVRMLMQQHEEHNIRHPDSDHAANDRAAVAHLESHFEPSDR